eukprot:g3855.t1
MDHLFEKIVAGTIPSFKIYDSPLVYAFMDINPLSRGHCLVIPKKKYEFLHEMPEETSAAIGRVLPRIAKAVMKVTGCKDYNILQNNGKNAHQFVPHVHFHIIPKPSKSAGLQVGWGAAKPIAEGVGAEVSALIAAELDAQSCCPAGSHPALVEDTSRKLSGEVVTLDGGLQVYYAPPPSATTKSILVVYDVHGFSGGRIKGVCDELASSGFHVAMADVYGDSKGVNDFGGFASESGKQFLQKFTWAALEPKLDTAIAFLKSKGGLNVASLGFCWGGWVVCHLSAAGKISAGASCHPSTRVAHLLYNEVELELVKSVRCPMLLCPAGNDPDNVKKGGEVVMAIRNSGQKCETVEFPEMMHGWVPRGDAKDAKVARDVNKALDLVSNFFKSNL